jgi:hypothetical protein
MQKHTHDHAADLNSSGRAKLSSGQRSGRINDLVSTFMHYAQAGRDRVNRVIDLLPAQRIDLKAVFWGTVMAGMGTVAHMKGVAPVVFPFMLGAMGTLAVYALDGSAYDTHRKDDEDNQEPFDGPGENNIV